MSEVTVADGVTFVGGRAVEQSTAGETHEGTDRGDELDEAKAAVKAALEGVSPDGQEQTQAEKEVAAAKKAVAAANEPPADDEAADARRLQELTAARKESAKSKQADEARAAEAVKAAQDEVRKVYAQLQKEKADLASERKRLELLKKDPLKAIRENGWDPEEFILDIANDGTPEGQAKRAQRELLERLERAEAWQKEQREEREQAARQAKVQGEAQFRRDVEQEFLNTVAAKAPDGKVKHEMLVTMYREDPASLIVQADLVAERYRKVTGKEATFGEIAEYLEERTAKWYKSMAERAAPAGETKPVAKTTRRTLGPDGSSERRSSAPATGDLDGDERRDAAIAAVRAALHATGGR